MMLPTLILSAALAQSPLATPDRLFVEVRDAEVPIDIAGVLEPEGAESEFGNDEARLCHGAFSCVCLTC